MKILTSPKISEAFELMVVSHQGQKYGNLPYFVHPVQVTEILVDGPWNASEDAVVGVLLHDVVEDTPMTLEEISALFGVGVAEIVRLVTKDLQCTYAQNIERIINSRNYSAMKVKLADNMANISSDKSFMSTDRRLRLNNRYAMSLAKLYFALGI